VSIGGCCNLWCCSLRMRGGQAPDKRLIPGVQIAFQSLKLPIVGTVQVSDAEQDSYLDRVDNVAKEPIGNDFLESKPSPMCRSTFLAAKTKRRGSPRCGGRYVA
jgi:hypothetical protein